MALAGLIGRSAAGKAMGVMTAPVSSYGRDNHCFSMRIECEKKRVNGEEVLSFKMCDYGECNPGPQPLAEEFTEVGKFVTAVSECIKTKAESL